MFIASKFFRGSMFKYTSIDQQVGPVADGKCFIYIVIGDQDTDVFIF